MLSLLRVKNLAVLKSVELELGPGLTVVTGETGAGKSILIAALKLVLGAKGSTGSVRTGEDTAEVEALFDVRGDPVARERLAAAGIDVADEVVVRRVLQASGRSRAYVDSKLATAEQLERLAAGLVDISSQHAHHTLADPRTHRTFLDGFAGNGALLGAVRGAWAALSRASDALDRLRDTARSRVERTDLLRFQLAEIDAIGLTAEAAARWAQDHERLAHAGELGRVASEVEQELYTRDGAICERLARLSDQVASAARRDPELEPLAQAADAAREELEEVARSLGAYHRRLDADPQRLADVEEKLAAVRRLERKHGGDVDIVLRRAAAAREELALLDDVEDRLADAEREVGVALDQARTAARALTRARRAAAEGLSGAITRELADLGMGHARVMVDLRTSEGGEGFAVDGAALGPDGAERVEFLIAPNPGEAPRPLREIASGGELSRSLLAVKRVLAERGPVGTYVFDEVDSGVGGAVADAIGRKLKDVARHHQVLCITHHAQIAAWGDRHLRVEKEVTGGRTASRVTELDRAARIEEMARMIGGGSVGDAARAAAAELLDQAGLFEANAPS